jgi:putative nucleotidyltransferase with HDIG domain
MSNSTLNQLALQEKTRRELLQRSDLIPPLPDLVLRLLTLLNKADTEPGDLEKHLQHDQVLVAKMFAMVNSPFYGLNRSVRTIKDAVMVLGFRGVRSLVLAASTAKFLQRDYSRYGHEPKGLWVHAACVASGAMRLARTCRLGEDTAEQSFVAGLLHDIGKLMLAPYVGSLNASAFPGGHATAEAERQALGIDHTEAGALVAAKWNLPLELQDVIKAHHDDDPQGGASPMAAIVRLADAVAHQHAVGYLPDRAPRAKVLPADLAALGLAAEAWPAIGDDVFAAMDATRTALASLGR